MTVAASLPITDAEPGVRLVLVDDDPMGLLLTACALRERGFEVLDFDRPDDALPVLMLTSLDDDEATRRACEAGASDYCIKSGNWTLLVHRIRQVLHMARLECNAGRVRAAPGSAMQAATVGAFDWQPDARRLRGSADLFRLLDWHDPPASLHDRHLLALIAPGDRRGVRRAMARLLAGGPTVRRELEVRTRGGRLRRLRIDVHQVLCTAGGVLEVGGAVHDVTPPEGDDAAVYRLTHCDRLTGLPNRTWLLERLADGDAALAIGRRAVEAPMEGAGLDRLEMERDLHYALARRELSMHCQPQVDATDGRVVGFEALMRWVRGGTTQTAGSFIPLAEETGLIVPFGEWAIVELGCPMQQGWLFGRALPIDQAPAFADAHGVVATEVAA